MGPWLLRVVRLAPDDGGLPASADEHAAVCDQLLTVLLPGHCTQRGDLERFAQLERQRSRRLQPPPGGAA